MSSDSLAEQLNLLQAENVQLKSQLAEPDLKAFEQIRELRQTNKRLTDEVKRLTGEGVQLAFKNRQLDQQMRKLQQELDEAVERGRRLDHSVEELQGELTQSRDTVLSHEDELRRQKEELSQRQQNLASLQEELTQREDRIARLEKLVHDFKEQFLSGDDFVAAVPQVAQEGAYAALMAEVDLALGVPGRTLVDQVYALLELPHDCEEAARLEELYETLQDTGCQVFSDPQEQESLKAALAKAWQSHFGKSSAPPQPQVYEPRPEPMQHAPVVELNEPLAEAELAQEPTLPPLSPLLEGPILGAEPETAAEPLPETEVAEEVVEVEEVAEVAEVADADLEPASETSEPEVPQMDVPELDLGALLAEDSAEEQAAEETVASSEFDLEAILGDESVAEDEPAEVVEPSLEDLIVDEEEQPVAVVEPSLEDLMAEESEIAPEVAPKSSPESWVPAQAQAKQAQITAALAIASSDPSQALEMLEQALEIETRVEAEARANLAVSRLKANQADVLPYLTEALSGAEVSDLFPLFAAAEGLAPSPFNDRLGLFYQFGMTSRTDMLKLEGPLGLGKRVLHRDFVSQIGNEDEEEIVSYLRDTLIPRAGLQLPIPSASFERRLENTGPAAFVGTLRQALRAVDYTLFDFTELKVLTYDGDESFLVDAAAEPDLTLIFHRDIEGMPPEELCFLVFRHLIRMYRGHSQLAQQASGLGDSDRLALAKAAIELYLEEGELPHPSLMARLQALQPGQPDFAEATCQLLIDWYQATAGVGFLYCKEFAFGDEVFKLRLDPVAEHSAARLVGITAATYGALRDELLGQDELLEELQDGLNDLFEGKPKLGLARLRVQRLWNEFLLEE